MAIEIKVPSVGESISEVILSRWIKNDGDQVQMDEVIAELESDKATFELTAEKAGILKTSVAEGDTVPVGQVVASIEEVSGETEKASTKEPADASSASASEEKPVVADAAGDADSSPTTQSKGASTVKEEATDSTDSYAKGTPSPAASKILSEKGIDPATLDGQGRDGRITKQDAEAATKPSPSSPSSTGSGASQSLSSKNDAPRQSGATVSDASAKGSRIQRRERLSNLRKTVGRRLVAVKNETAMLTTFNEVDMQPIMDLRGKYKDKFKEKYGVGLGFMSFFTKAVCEALKEFPAVNAMIDGDEIIYNDYADISIAVSAPKGLVVPVIRNAEGLSFAQIEKAVMELALKARENKLTIEEMTGGTFSITNGGIFGSMMSTPILNPPQSAILGMHNIVERPVAVNGQVLIRPIMYVALSYDHRIIDGRESVGFLVKVKQMLEDPSRLLLGI